MDKAKAVKIKAELLEYARKYSLWVDVQETRKPDLKNITIAVSILVTEKAITS